MRDILLVGYGVRGRQLARAIEASRDLRVSVVVEKRALEDSDRPHAPVFTSIDNALQALRFDGAVVATPPASHAQDVERFLSLGIPTLCEKPLSEDIGEASSLARLASKLRVPLVVGMNFRFVPAAQEFHRIVASGRLGAVQQVFFAYFTNRDGRHPALNKYPLTMSDPMLLDQSIHHLDLLRWVFGEVAWVQGVSWNPTGSVYEGDSGVGCFLGLRSGVIIIYLGTWTSGSRRMSYEWRADFEGGVVMQKEPFGDLYISKREPGIFRTVYPSDPQEVEPLCALGLPVGERFFDETVAMINTFAEVISGQAGGAPTGADHIHTLLLLEAIKLSGESGSRIYLEEVDGRRGVKVSHGD